MKILVDTCTFLWIISDGKQLSRTARDLFRAPEHEVFLSSASCWEMATKYGLGRLPLPQPPDRFIPAMRQAHGIEALLIDEEAALQTAKLPPLHRDPFDRMLISQAIVHGLTLLTPDPLISRYPVRVAW
jgi:PIN domain nuclease of toxin-antitoxin system